MRALRLREIHCQQAPFDVYSQRNLGAAGQRITIGQLLANHREEHVLPIGTLQVNHHAPLLVAGYWRLIEPEAELRIHGGLLNSGKPHSMAERDRITNESRADDWLAFERNVRAELINRLNQPLAQLDMFLCRLAKIQRAGSFDRRPVANRINGAWR